MFALKIFATLFVVCASKPWPVSSTYKNFQDQHPLLAEI